MEFIKKRINNMENELLKTIEEKLSKNKDEIMAILNQNIKNE